MCKYLTLFRSIVFDLVQSDQIGRQMLFSCLIIPELDSGYPKYETQFNFLLESRYSDRDWIRKA